MATYGQPYGLTRSEREYRVRADRREAGFAAWYEFFPRSTTSDPARHGTFRDAERALPRIAGLGFDVVYLPPIHPIGRTHRKGPNNALVAEPDDPGSPWAIGNEHGGHTRGQSRAGHAGRLPPLRADRALPRHGGGARLRAPVLARSSLGAGAPGLVLHPPRRHHQVRRESAQEVRGHLSDQLLVRPARGAVGRLPRHLPVLDPAGRADLSGGQPAHQAVRVLGVGDRRGPAAASRTSCSSPRRSPVPSGCRPWRGSASPSRTPTSPGATRRPSCAEYLTELTQPAMADFFRGNFFANTPDILHEFLQRGGPPAFRIRLLLAGTLSPLYGIYSGFELSENVPVREGSEEYLDSEKYQVRVRDWSAPGNLDADLARLNQIRRAEPALADAHQPQLPPGRAIPTCSSTSRAPGAATFCAPCRSNPREPVTAELDAPARAARHRRGRRLRGGGSADRRAFPLAGGTAASAVRSRRAGGLHLARGPRRGGAG